MSVSRRAVIKIGSEDDSNSLSYAQVKLIHAGLLIPNEHTVKRLAREVLQWRGEKDPDAV